jgi:hypothetical protein
MHRHILNTGELAANRHLSETERGDELGELDLAAAPAHVAPFVTEQVHGFAELLDQVGFCAGEDGVFGEPRAEGHHVFMFFLLGGGHLQPAVVGGGLFHLVLEERLQVFDEVTAGLHLVDFDRAHHLLLLQAGFGGAAGEVHHALEVEGVVWVGLGWAGHS